VAGFYYSVAVKSDGTVWAWGDNAYGQLGDGTTIDRSSPVQFAAPGGIVAAAAGSYHSIVLKNDGTILTVGYNDYGQLGDGSKTSRLAPVEIDDLFPTNGVMPANWVSSSWQAVNGTTFAGPSAIAGVSVDPAGTHDLSFTGSFRDGFVKFTVGELGADPYLHGGTYWSFYVDDVLRASGYVEGGWRGGVFVPAGTHKLSWRYVIDTTGTMNTNLPFIDSVELPTAFSDVPSNSWAFDYVNALKDAGITTGCGTPGNYCPSTNVTREQMAAFIIRAKEGEPSACTSAPFADVPTSNAFCKYVKRMLDLNITTGCGGGNYCPSQNVDRQQMAAFIIRAVEGNPVAGYCGSTSPFGDVPANSGFCGHIKRMLELNITTGCGNGNYCPTQTVTRDQMAAFLARAFLGM
jgi:hypothetical protein